MSICPAEQLITCMWAETSTTVLVKTETSGTTIRFQLIDYTNNSFNSTNCLGKKDEDRINNCSKHQVQHITSSKIIFTNIYRHISSQTCRLHLTTASTMTENNRIIRSSVISSSTAKTSVAIAASAAASEAAAAVRRMTTQPRHVLLSFLFLMD